MISAVRPSAIWMILTAAFLDMMAMGIVLPVLPGLIEDPTGSLAATGIWAGGHRARRAYTQGEYWEERVSMMQSGQTSLIACVMKQRS